MRIDPLEDGRGSFSWRADGRDGMRRTSTALVLDEGVLLIDPVDVPGLDEAVAPLGRVMGCCTLLDRHARDTGAVAGRHGVPVLVPSTLAGSGEPLVAAGVQERAIVAVIGWNESCLWLPERRLLVCADAVGTIGPFLARSSDRLGIHPLLRVRPPRGALGPLEPATIAVGHGPPLTDGATEALRFALADARGGLPRAWGRMAAEIGRGLRPRR
jgi:hypothetical protein